LAYRSFALPVSVAERVNSQGTHFVLRLLKETGPSKAVPKRFEVRCE